MMDRAALILFEVSGGGITDPRELGPEGIAYWKKLALRLSRRTPFRLTGGCFADTPAKYEALIRAWNYSKIGSAEESILANLVLYSPLTLERV